MIFEEIKDMIMKASKKFKGMRKLEDLENEAIGQRSYTLTPHTGAVISDFIAVYGTTNSKGEEIVTVSTHFKELYSIEEVKQYLKNMKEVAYETAI